MRTPTSDQPSALPKAPCASAASATTGLPPVSAMRSGAGERAPPATATSDGARRAHRHAARAPGQHEAEPLDREGAIERRAQAAAVEHGDAVRAGDESRRGRWRSARRRRRERAPRAAPRTPLRAAAMSRPRVGLTATSTRGAGGQRAGDDELLHVAAGEAPRRRVEVAGLDARTHRPFACAAARSRRRPEERAARRASSADVEHGVVARSIRSADDALAQAVGRNGGDAGGDRRGGREARAAACRRSRWSRSSRAGVPVRTSNSSAWPLPSTPAMPTISPARTERLTSSSAGRPPSPAAPRWSMRSCYRRRDGRAAAPPSPASMRARRPSAGPASASSIVAPVDARRRRGPAA